MCPDPAATVRQMTSSARTATGVRRQQRAFALAAGALLATVVSLLVLGTGSSEAAGGHHRHHATSVRIPKDFLGVLSGRIPFDGRDVARISRIGIGTARIGMPWVSAQRKRGPFTWTSSDPMVARLAKNGISALPTLAGTPSWVADKATMAPVFDQDAKDAWQTFVTAAVRRYRPGGTFWTPVPGGKSPFHTLCGCNAPPAPITAWQIWNEPNLRKYFAPSPSPKLYGELVKLSSSAIEAVDSDATVVLAGLSDGGDPNKRGATPFLKRFYRVPGIKKSFDAVGIHPYARNISNLRRAMTSFRKVMKRKRDARTPLWITEMGWGSGHPNHYGHNKGLRGQKRLLQRSVTILAKNRKRWRVAHAYWFFWRDPPKSVGNLPCSFCTSAGLLKSNRRPKPAYRAFKSLATGFR
jgi:hypothetical protein